MRPSMAAYARDEPNQRARRESLLREGDASLLAGALIGRDADYELHGSFFYGVPPPDRINRRRLRAL